MIRSLSAEEALALAPELAAVYDAAFTAPGYDETEADVERWRDESLPLHAVREGFRCVAAFEEDAPIGFAYGYVGRRGQWWTDEVARRAPSQLAATWLDGHFEFVELAVAPAAQRHGHGRALHDTLMAGVTRERALLTTYAADLPAPRLYRRLGWELLVREIFEGRDLYGVRVSGAVKTEE